jgi:hypothetical protein
MLLTLVGYTSATIIFGYFFLKIPVHAIIQDQYGDNRIAWLLCGIAADSIARVYRLFEEPLP